MKGLHSSILLTSCIIAAALGMTSAWAADGTISFSGAVVEPTCAIDGIGVTALVTQAAATVGPIRQRCADQVSGSAHGSSPFHTLVFSTVSAKQPEADQLLRYFAGYLRAAGMAPARLVTQTFE